MKLVKNSRFLIYIFTAAVALGIAVGCWTFFGLPLDKIAELQSVWQYAHVTISFAHGFLVALIFFFIFTVLNPSKRKTGGFNWLNRLAALPFKTADGSADSGTRLALQWHIAIYLVAALAVLYFPAFWLWANGFLSVPRDENLEVWMKILLPIIGGIGGVFYLVLKYREQQNNEANLKFSEQEARRHQENFQRELQQKEKELERTAQQFDYERGKEKEKARQEELQAAVRLLGDESPQVRLAGVYALTDVADKYTGIYKQRVVDILCGYLRTDRLATSENGKLKYAAVEDTIIRVIAEHLRKDRDDLEEKVQTLLDDQLWCDCSFNFKSAIFSERVDFSNTTWNQDANFIRTVFKEQTKFIDAVFRGKVNFNRVLFVKDVSFYGAKFFGYFKCFEGVFMEYTQIVRVGFYDDIAICDSHFIGETTFSESDFKESTRLEDTKFYSALFSNFEADDKAINAFKLAEKIRIPSSICDESSLAEARNTVRELLAVVPGLFESAISSDFPVSYQSFLI